MTTADGSAAPGPRIALVEVTNQTLVAVLPLLPGVLLLFALGGCILPAECRLRRLEHQWGLLTAQEAAALACLLLKDVRSAVTQPVYSP